MKTIHFVLISPYNKKNLIPFVKKLVQINRDLNSDLEFIATSGSYKILEKEIINISRIEEFTGYKESPEGLVKTLHPKIFFGFLGDESKKEHVQAFKDLKTRPIDLLVSNLYPFWEIKDRNLSIKDLTYYWDIGGPSMIMAAIKGNHTLVLTDPDDYDAFLNAIRDDTKENELFLKKLNVKALKYVVDYHKMIGEYFEKNLPC